MEIMCWYLVRCACGLTCAAGAQVKPFLHLIMALELLQFDKFILPLIQPQSWDNEHATLPLPALLPTKDKVAVQGRVLATVGVSPVEVGESNQVF